MMHVLVTLAHRPANTVQYRLQSSLRAFVHETLPVTIVILVII